LSEGTHNGAAEAEDVWAALDWLESEYKLPMVAAGFSFGAAMTLSACCKEDRTKKNLRALALLGLPLDAAGRGYSYSVLKNCTLPKLFLSGDRDQFAPAERLHELSAKVTGPKRVVLVHGADHFFSGHMNAMQEALAAWLKEQMQ
jgi:uncharacterized protein